MDSLDAIQQMTERAPLMRFSPYTHIQVETVLGIGAEILEVLDKAIDGNKIDARGFTRAYSLFWLWVLASFEITRTLCRERSCLSDRLATDVCSFKARLAHLRAPFAKLQPAGARRPIIDEASVNLLDTVMKDLSFRVGEQNFSARNLVIDFARMIGSIKAPDVRKSIYGQVYSEEG